MDTALRKFASKYFKIRAEDVTDEKNQAKAWIFKVVPLVGFELTTYRLQGGCSTN